MLVVGAETWVFGLDSFSGFSCFDWLEIWLDLLMLFFGCKQFSLTRFFGRQ
jgi:hypothetical protein